MLTARERLPAVRCMFDGPTGMRVTTASLVDVVEDGCELRLNARVEPGMVGRVELNLGDRKLWFPVIVSFARPYSGRWTVTTEFDRLTAEKSAALGRLLAQRKST